MSQSRSYLAVTRKYSWKEEILVEGHIFHVTRADARTPMPIQEMCSAGYRAPVAFSKGIVPTCRQGVGTLTHKPF